MSNLIPLEYPVDDDDLPFSKEFFFTLLATSLSLDLEDKIKVMKSLPTLSVFQMVSLVEVWIEERVKFVELGKKYPDDIKKLLVQITQDWQTLKQIYELPELLSDEDVAQQIEQLSQNAAYQFGLTVSKALSGTDDDDDDDDDDEIAEEAEEKVCKREMGQEKGARSSLFSAFVNLGVDKEMDKALALDVKIPKPHELCQELENIIIGQSNALYTLSTMLYYHKLFAVRLAQKYNRTDRSSPVKYMGNGDDYARQQPILLIGATGTGKTHLIKHVTKAFGLNVVTVDCSTMVRTGIVGSSLDTIGRMIYEGAKEDVRVAETSVVVLDEFDKLFLEGSRKLEVAVQLLTVLEGSAPFPIERYNQEKSRDYPVSISAERMMFIVSGSFGMHQKNLAQRFRGFSHNDVSEKPLQEYDHVFLSEFGLPDELLGRIGRIICLETLDAKDYARVLYQSPTSPWNVLQNQLKMVGCTAELPEYVVEHLIEQNKDAIDKFGSRGLYQAFNRLPCITQILLRATTEIGSDFNIDGHFMVRLGA
ncbi:MAG: AAA family ATPase [Moraxella sp.]|nr:AAA family ATPase [Moraxella sp.]